MIKQCRQKITMIFMRYGNENRQGKDQTEMTGEQDWMTVVSALPPNTEVEFTPLKGTRPEREDYW